MKYQNIQKDRRQMLSEALIYVPQKYFFIETFSLKEPFLCISKWTLVKARALKDVNAMGK